MVTAQPTALEARYNSCPASGPAEVAAIDFVAGNTPCLAGAASREDRIRKSARKRRC